MANLSKRTRVFSLITYIGEDNIKEVIQLHSRSIRAWAYIYHDKEESTPHWHLLIRTYDAWSTNQILKWFDKYKNEINENTLGQPATDMHALRDYITHSDYESRQKGKHLYDEKDIVDGGMFALVEKKDSFDETYAIINDLLLGTKTREMIRRYGKNYLYHIQQFDIAKERILWDDMRSTSMGDIIHEVATEVYGKDPLDDLIENSR